MSQNREMPQLENEITSLLNNIKAFLNTANLDQEFKDFFLRHSEEHCETYLKGQSSLEYYKKQHFDSGNFQNSAGKRTEYTQ